MFKTKVMLFLVGIILLLCIVGCSDSDLYQEIEEVTGTVTDLTYENPQTVQVLTYDAIQHKSVWVTRIKPASYNVTIAYEDISTTIDDSDLYNEVSIGDYVSMILKTTYDSSGEIVDTSLQLPEAS